MDVSRATAGKIIDAAKDKNLIEPTNDNIHDPKRGYALTRTGQATVARI